MPEDNAKAAPTKMMFYKILSMEDDAKAMSAKIVICKGLFLKEYYELRGKKREEYGNGIWFYFVFFNLA